MTTQEHFLNLLELLKIEKQADFEQFQRFMQNTSLQVQKEKGVTWHPLQIVESGYGLGDYPYLIVERTQLIDRSHQFYGGNSIVIFSTLEEYKEEEVKGSIHFVNRNQMKINFLVDELPDWINKGKLGVRLYFDEGSFQQMEKTLHNLSSNQHPRALELANILLGNQKAHFEKSHLFEIPTLNYSQNKAVHEILTAYDVALVHGPPGTGKTTTLVEAIAQLAKHEKNILVTAPSNAAVDLLTEKLAEAGLSVLRIGNLSRIDEKVVVHTLEQLMTKHPQYKEIKKARKEAQELRKIATQYKRSFGKEERQQRNLLLQEAKNVAKHGIATENHIIETLLNHSQVITTTLVGSNHHYLEKIHFKTVFIDEAAQALEPATWIPISKAEKVVLAGDPFQLPPTVKSDLAKKKGLAISLMEHGIQQLEKVSLLDTQYRMNELIMNFSNQEFYKNQLKADKNVANHCLIDEFPMEFIDTAGCSFEEESVEGSTSLHNVEECKLIQKHLEELQNRHQAEEYTVGVISPYKGQVEYMKTVFSSQENVSINTIDSFQGQEKDVIYISLVRSNLDGEIGFLKDYRRMNVAMTRAKKKLVIIGDSGTLGNDKFYNNFLNYCEKIEAYKTAWEFM